MMNTQRDNVKAGIFVALGLVLAMVLLFILTDFRRLTETKQEILVSYSLADGLQGLKEGASVTLGDQPIGSVTQISDRFDPSDARKPIGKQVRLRIPGHYRISQDAVIEVVSQPLGTGASINIRSVGSGEPYRSNQPITGFLSGNPLTKNLMRDVGIQDLQRRQIQEIIANLQTITAVLRDELPIISRNAHQTINELHQASTQANEILSELRQHTPTWVPMLDRTLTSAEQFAQQANALLKEKEPALRQTLDDLQQVAHDLRFQRMVQVELALDKAVQAMDKLNESAAHWQSLVVGQRPVLERTLANAELTSAQLKLAAIEIRRSPWRLLYQPKTQELESDNLYDAARSFALAAGSLESTAQSLKALADQPNVDPAQVRAMLDRLEMVFQRYQQTESAFWKSLPPPLNSPPK